VTEVTTQKFIESVINLLHLMNSYDKKTVNEKIAQKLAETNPKLLEDLKFALTELEYSLDELQGLTKSFLKV
jgi:DNA-directed RNA polymerase subunit F